MAGRGLRARAAVNYNDKDSMEVAWLKSMNSGPSGSPSGNDSLQDSPGSSEKENAASKRRAGKANKPAKQPPAPKPKTAEKPQPKAKDKVVEKAAVPARGRNAGVKVVPIADHKKAPRVSGLRKPKSAAASDAHDAALPKPPPVPKEVPGLPGVVQKSAPKATPPQRAASTSGSGSRGSKRKKTAAGVEPLEEAAAPAPKRQAVAAPAPAAQAKQRQQSYQQPPAAVQLAGPQHHHHHHQQQQQAMPAPAPSYHSHVPAPAAAELPAAPWPGPDAPPALLVFPELPATDLEQHVERLSANFAALQEHCRQLQRENEELKGAKISEQVEALLAQQDVRVAEHGAKASQLAQHWKAEAERIAAELEAAQDGGNAGRVAMLKSEAQLNTCRQALVDMDVAGTQKDKVIAELQGRNAYLERHARVPEVADKCVGTDPLPQTSAGVQAPSMQPSGQVLPQGRCLVPEGASGSFVYRHSAAAAASLPAMNATYTLAPQRTRAGGQAPSDMHLVSSGPGGPAQQAQQQQQQQRHVQGGAPAAAPPIHPGTGLTAESVQAAAVQQQQQQQQQQRQRATLHNPALQRQLQFHSHSHSLEPVQEGGPAQPASGSLPMAPREKALENLTGITATPLRGGKFLYTHAATGYRFEVGPAPPEAESETEYEEEGGGDNEEADSEVFDMIYRVVDLGTARPLLERQPLGESLMASFTFPQSQREWLMRTVMDALARAPHP